MPRLEKSKYGTGAGWTAPGIQPARRWFTDENLSPVRCHACRMRLPLTLANAGDRTHPTCDGMPTQPAATSAGKQARTPARRPDSTRRTR